MLLQFSNCTDRLQPLDLSVNKPVKDLMRQKFRSWYANKVKEELEAGTVYTKVFGLSEKGSGKIFIVGAPQRITYTNCGYLMRTTPQILL